VENEVKTMESKVGIEPLVVERIKIIETVVEETNA
jgi:hypothetical protein